MRWWVRPLVALVVGGVVGFVAGQAGPTAHLRNAGQYDLMEGVALIGMANAVLHTKTPGRGSATVWGYEGIAYLQASTVPLRALGVPDADSVYWLVMPAENNILEGRASERDRRIVQRFETELKPFARVNWGSIPDSQLETALHKIVNLANAGAP